MEQGIVVQGIAYDKNIAKINILGRYRHFKYFGCSRQNFRGDLIAGRVDQACQHVRDQDVFRHQVGAPRRRRPRT